MVNYNYNNGRNFEYKVMHFFEGIGAEVVRSAGSHGIDLVVMFPSPISQNWLISCKKSKKFKKNYVTGSELEQLEHLRTDYKNDGVFIAYPLKGLICLNPVK